MYYIDNPFPFYELYRILDTNNHWFSFSLSKFNMMKTIDAKKNAMTWCDKFNEWQNEI